MNQSRAGKVQTAAGQAEELVREIVAAMDRGDFGAALSSLAADASVTDELSDGWVRGRPRVIEHYAWIASNVSSIESELVDLRSMVVDNVAVVTALMTQRYERHGHPVRIVAPTTFVLRRLDGPWEVVLIHSVGYQVPR